MAEQSPRLVLPYPSAEDDPWFDAFRDFVNAIDAVGYASREDRHAVLAEGGVINWTAPTFSWASALMITAPITGFLWQIPAGNIDIANGETAYVTLSRAPGSNTNVAIVASSTVPSTNDAFAIATRIGDRLYVRNGLLLNNTDAVTNIGSAQGVGGAGGANPRTAPIIVGNTGAGDVSSDADYLDIGDGAQLAAALAAATSDTEVYIRPGVYDLGVGATVPFIVPAGVRVRGAAAGASIIRTKSSDDMSAITLSEDSQLVDVGVEVALPTGPGNTADYVVRLNGNYAKCERVRVTFLGAYGGTQATNLFIRGVFSVSNNMVVTKQLNCEIFSAPSLRDNSVAADLIGWRVVGGTTATQPHVINGAVAYGLDIAAALRNRCHLRGFNFHDQFNIGVEVSAQASRSQVGEGQIRNAAADASWVGIHIQDSITRLLGSDMTIEGVGGQSGVLFDDTVNRCAFRGVNVEAGITNGLELTANTVNNQAIGCLLIGPTNPVVDGGTGNDVMAHNITS
jgi:hypothetical protein